MYMTTIDRPLAGEPLLPLATHRLRSRFSNFLISSGLCAPGVDALKDALANGFFAHHERGVVVTATSCDRPLFYTESEMLAQFLLLDLILLRFDPLTGASFDVLLAGSRTWLSEFIAWRREGDDIWLVPARASGPFIQLTEAGIDVFESAPYANGYERYSGIINAIDHPSFERRA
jgi:hypothetical protein